MTGLIEGLALFEIVSEIGVFLGWRNRTLIRRVNFFHASENRKSPFDRLIRAKTGSVVTRQDRLCLKLADGVTQLIRNVVKFDAFRHMMRALALPNSPLRRGLRTHRRPV